MSPARFTRMIEQEAIDGDKAYRPVDFLADVRKGVWGEVNGTAAAPRSMPTAATCSALIWI